MCQWSQSDGGRPTAGGSTTHTQYILDTVGDLPVILCEVGDSGSLIKSYYYAHAQPLAQIDHTDPDGDGDADELYFYLHDRLGSVRLVIDDDAVVMHTYTYDPFGEIIDQYDNTGIAPTNAFLFTGQWYDTEIGHYCLRARMYAPALMRFTTRDPVLGKNNYPLTLHKYLYCVSDPVNYIDIDGKMAIALGGSISGNFTASDLGNALITTPGLQGLAALVAYYNIMMPAAVTELFKPVLNHYGLGATGGAAFVAAWDHTKGWRSLTDGDAWSSGTMQWIAGGHSVSTGAGGSITLDLAVSNATHVQQLAGGFIEGGGSASWFAGGGMFSLGGTVSLGVDEDGLTGIWLATIAAGGATGPGAEGHLYVGYTWVQEFKD